jgi:hypothetical protein
VAVLTVAVAMAVTPATPAVADPVDTVTLTGSGNVQGRIKALGDIPFDLAHASVTMSGTYLMLAVTNRSGDVTAAMYDLPGWLLRARGSMKFPEHLSPVLNRIQVVTDGTFTIAVPAAGYGSSPTFTLTTPVVGTVGVRRDLPLAMPHATADAVAFQRDTNSLTLASTYVVRDASPANVGTSQLCTRLVGLPNPVLRDCISSSGNNQEIQAGEPILYTSATWPSSDWPSGTAVTDVEFARVPTILRGEFAVMNLPLAAA